MLQFGGFLFVSRATQFCHFQGGCFVCEWPNQLIWQGVKLDNHWFISNENSDGDHLMTRTYARSNVFVVCVYFFLLWLGDNWILIGTSLNSKSSIVCVVCVVWVKNEIHIRRSLACRYELDDTNTHNWWIPWVLVAPCPNRTNNYFSNTRFTVLVSMCRIRAHRDRPNASVQLECATDKKK